MPNVLTIRLASGVKALPAAPSEASYSLTLPWSTDKPSRVYAHRSLACHPLQAKRDLNWNDHSTLKLIQFHQYPLGYVHDAEHYDEGDVLRQGGGDGGFPPAEDLLGPGPIIESIHSDSDPADAPVPDTDTDFDLDDEDFWTTWLAEIKSG